MRYCINCAYKETEGKFFFCTRPSLVTGEVQQNIRQKCADERVNTSLCGPDGKFWQMVKEKNNGTD